MSAPEPTAASTTTVTRANPLMRRFRCGKAPGVGPFAGREFAEQQSAGGDAVVQRRLAAGIDDAEPVAEHADGASAGIESAGVRRRIESRGHAAHNDDPAPPPRGISARHTSAP